MEILWDVAGFGAKALLVFITFVLCALVAAALVRRGRRPPAGIRVRAMNQSFRRTMDQVRRSVMTAKDFKRDRRQRAKAERKRDVPEKNLYVLDFKGDMVAGAVDSLREEITAVVSVARPGDEVVLRLESAGGVMHAYGLAASHLTRLKARNVHLTVCIDRIAASGGYLMACVADEILAAPFAIVGSIGVAAPVPNLHRLLDRHGVDYEEMTAGEYKRTVSMLAEITEKGRAKLQEQIEDAHALFKEFVEEYRPGLDLEEVGTGEHWYGSRAEALGLVNRLVTSDDYLLSRLDEANLYAVTFERQRKVRERIAQTMSVAAEKLLISLWSRLNAAGHR
jgi:serine protease SohB